MAILCPLSLRSMASFNPHQSNFFLKFCLKRLLQESPCRAIDGNSVFSLLSPEEAFKECENLNHPEFPSLKTISKDAFNGCNALESAYLPDGLVEVKSLAFENNTGIKSAVFPATVTTLEKDAFEGCFNLESIVYGDGLENVERPFDGTNKRTEDTYNIQTLTFGANTKEILSFTNLDKLRAIRILNPVPPRAATCRFNQNEITLVIPDGEEVMNAYKSHAFWKRFMLIVSESDYASGVNSVTEDSFFYIDGKELTILPGLEATVYSLDGRVVFKGSGAVRLPKGIFIIRSDSRIAKVRII